MPGFIVHLGATVLCAHGGQAMPTSPNPRVLVSGQPVATQPTPYAIAGCPFMTGPTPHLASWDSGSRRPPASWREEFQSFCSTVNPCACQRNAVDDYVHANTSDRDVTLMALNYPFQFDGSGCTAMTGEVDRRAI